MGAAFVPSPHFERGLRPSETEVGTKAVGLFDLPSAWTPPFLAVTNAVRRELTKTALRPGWLLEVARGVGVTAMLNRLIAESDTIIVRSSAAEHIEDRGQLRSVECAATVGEVEAAITECWDANEDLIPAEKCLGLIIQPKVNPVRLGHLSNERRVSERHDSWLVEELVVDRPEPEELSLRISPVGKNEVDLKIPLTCAEPRELTRRLREVAAASLGSRGRRHYEWVWDGAQLWIVQRDFERTSKGEAPASRWKSIPSAHVDNLRVWLPEEHSSGKWPKANCVKTFRDCGFATQEIFVLENEDVIEALASGRILPQLGADLNALAQEPLVVRSDVLPSTGHSGLMLPRTETCRSVAQVESFLQKTAARFVVSSVPPNEVAFLAHRFIPATAGSYSYAIPRIPRIRTDSIWGVPDGLLFFAHDSFEYDVDAGHTTWEKTRCKREYVDFDRDGTWFEKTAGTPWDWQESLTEDQRGTIASQTRVLADHVGHPVELMHFVGVRNETGLPDCLPWFYKHRESIATGADDGVQRLGRPTFVVTSPKDFDTMTARMEHPSPHKFSSFRLRPIPDYLHDEELVKAAAAFAIQHQLTIDLEGSVLSHAYYLLHSAGARVRIIDQEEPPAARGVRQFNKLVRDAIPEIIEKRGERAVVVRASASQLVQLLKTKLVEEAVELEQASGRDSLLEEAADVFEVLRALCGALGEDIETAIALAHEKRASRGGFEGGYVLRGTYINPVVGTERAGQLFDLEMDDEVARRLHRPDRLVAVDEDLEGGMTRFRVPRWLSRGNREFAHDLRRTKMEGHVRIRAEATHILVEVRHNREAKSHAGQLQLPLSD